MTKCILVIQNILEASMGRYQRVTSPYIGRDIMNELQID